MERTTALVLICCAATASASVNDAKLLASLKHFTLVQPALNGDDFAFSLDGECEIISFASIAGVVGASGGRVRRHHKGHKTATFSLLFTAAAAAPFPTTTAAAVHATGAPNVHT